MIYEYECKEPECRKRVTVIRASLHRDDPLRCVACKGETRRIEVPAPSVPKIPFKIGGSR